MKEKEQRTNLLLNQPWKKLKEALDVDDFLPLATIKSYFSRRAKALKEGKIKISNDDDLNDDADENAEDEDEDDEEDEAQINFIEERVNAVNTIETSVAKINQ